MFAYNLAKAQTFVNYGTQTLSQNHQNLFRYREIADIYQKSPSTSRGKNQQNNEAFQLSMRTIRVTQIETL